MFITTDESLKRTCMRKYVKKRKIYEAAWRKNVFSHHQPMVNFHCLECCCRGRSRSQGETFGAANLHQSSKSTCLIKIIMSAERSKSGKTSHNPLLEFLLMRDLRDCCQIKDRVETSLLFQKQRKKGLERVELIKGDFWLPSTDSRVYRAPQVFAN